MATTLVERKTRLRRQFHSVARVTEVRQSSQMNREKEPIPVPTGMRSGATPIDPPQVGVPIKRFASGDVVRAVAGETQDVPVGQGGDRSLPCGRATMFERELNECPSVLRMVVTSVGVGHYGDRNRLRPHRAAVLNGPMATLAGLRPPVHEAPVVEPATRGATARSARGQPHRPNPRLSRAGVTQFASGTYVVAPTRARLQIRRA